MIEKKYILTLLNSGADMRYIFLCLAVLTSGCSRLPSPVLQADPLHKEWILTKSMTWKVNKSHSITIPEGFVTDFASIPPGIGLILSKHDSYSTAAVVHDFLYWSQGCTRAQADNLFNIAMHRDGVSKLKRFSVYQGVSLGGNWAWDENRKSRKSGIIKVLPPEIRSIFLQNGLETAQKKALLKGYKDPPFEENPPYCTIQSDPK